jgi:FixJ family two-component response regulator
MGVDLPMIFIARHGDIRMGVRAMKAGAIDVLTRPFRDQDVLDAIHAAIERNRARRQSAALLSVLRDRYSTLTPRERQTMRLVAFGLPNKKIAYELDVTVGVVKAHRGQVMRKMRARSLPELVRMADRLVGGRGNPTVQSAYTPSELRVDPQHDITRVTIPELQEGCVL